MNYPILRTTQINLYDCTHPLMDNPEEMEIFLSKLIKFIKMNLIDKNMVGTNNPHAFWYNPDNVDANEHGVTGKAILVESHVAAHSWPKKTFLNIVITSCKEYDPGVTALWVLGYCKSKVFKYNTISF